MAMFYFAQTRGGFSLHKQICMGMIQPPTPPFNIKWLLSNVATQIDNTRLLLG